MGCGSSTVPTLPSIPSANGDNYSPLSEEEILKRIVDSKQDEVLKFDASRKKGDGNFEVRYAFVSQKGYYPNGKFEGFLFTCRKLTNLQFLLL